LGLWECWKGLTLNLPVRCNRRSSGEFSYEIDHLLDQFLYGPAAINSERGEPKLANDTAVHLLQQGLIHLEQASGFGLVHPIEPALTGAPVGNPASRQVTVHIEVDQGVTNPRSGNYVLGRSKNCRSGQAGFTYDQSPALLDDSLIQNEDIGAEPAADGETVGPDIKADRLPKSGPVMGRGGVVEMNGPGKEPGMADEVSGKPRKMLNAGHPLATYIVPVSAGVALLA
jgi:hypothetical protein